MKKWQIFWISLILLAAGSAFAGDERRITVSGQCKRQVPPDRGAVVLVAENRDKDLKTAAKKTTDAYNRLLESVKRLKLEEVQIETSEYVLNEIREWEKDRSVFKGYRARMGLDISTSQIQRLGEVVLLGAQQEVQETGQLRTFLSGELIQKETQVCLRDAVEVARQKAQKMAESAGVRLGGVVAIHESSGSTFDSPMPRPMLEGMTLKARAASDLEAPSIEGGKKTIQANVTVVFEIQK